MHHTGPSLLQIRTPPSNGQGRVKLEVPWLETGDSGCQMRALSLVPKLGMGWGAQLFFSCDPWANGSQIS